MGDRGNLLSDGNWKAPLVRKNKAQNFKEDYFRAYLSFNSQGSG